MLLALTVQIYKLYFSMSAVFLMKDLHLQLEGFESELKLCPVGDLCSYKFFRGMLEVCCLCNLVCADTVQSARVQRNAWQERSFFSTSTASPACTWREVFSVFR